MDAAATQLARQSSSPGAVLSVAEDAGALSVAGIDMDATGSAAIDNAGGDPMTTAGGEMDASGMASAVTATPADGISDAGGATLISGLTKDVETAAMPGNF